MLKQSIFILLILSCSVILIGQESQGIKFKWSGDAEAESYRYFNEFKDLGHYQNELKANLSLKSTLSERLSFVSKVQWILGNNEYRRLLDLREVYGTFRKKIVTIKLGKQIVDWSSLPGWSPSDLPNHFRYFDFIDTHDEERGQWTVNSRIRGKNFSLGITVSPFFSHSLLYLENNRWVNLPNRIALDDHGEVVVPLEYAGFEKVDESRGYQFGVEAAFQTGQIEWTLRHYHGYNDIPVRQLELSPFNPTEPVRYNIQLLYHDMQISSLQMNTFLGRWNTWGELAYTKSMYLDEDEQLAPSPFYTATIGLDRVFDFIDPEKELKLLAQYILSFNTVGINYQSNDLDHVFNNAILTRISYRANYDLKFELTGVAEMKTMGFYLKPTIEYKFFDFLVTQLGMELLAGDDKGFFGHYKDNRRVRFAIKYYFNPKSKL